MSSFAVVLLIATLLCTLVAGFLFAFVVVVMPGIAKLDDHTFLRAFQLMDRIIQNNHPLFMIVWVGSVIALIAAVILGFGDLDRAGRTIIVAALAIYLLGVQAPTAIVNIPLNNEVQSHDVGSMAESAAEEARMGFEPRWNRWNTIRTFFAVVVSALLLILLLRL